MTEKQKKHFLRVRLKLFKRHLQLNLEARMAGIWKRLNPSRLPQ